MNNIAIIGDTGLIGSSLKKLLKTKQNYNSNNIDLFDPSMTKSITSDIDKIIFLAGDPRMFYYNDKPSLCLKNNYELIKNIIRNDISYFIFLSTVCVYSEISNFSNNRILGWNNVSTFYGISKLLAEYEIKLHVKNYCILRLSTPFGHRMTKGPLFDLIKNKESYVSLNSEYSFLHIDDIINAIKHVLNNKITGCYNLTSNKSTSLKSLLKEESSINIISNNCVKYDSDNVSLVETGWHQEIDVRHWITEQKLTI